MSDSELRLENLRSKPGFTLVELLVVVAIIGILVGMILPAVQMVRAAARRTKCSKNIRNIALALHNFESAHGYFPSGIHAEVDPDFPSMTWLVEILPFIEQDSLWQQSQRDYQSGSSPFSPHVGFQSVVTSYECPSVPTSGQPQYTYDNLLVALTCYLGVNGTNYQAEDGVFYKSSKTRVGDISDGLSNTLLIGERPPSSDFWYGWWYAGVGQQGSGSPDMLLGVRELNNGANHAEDCDPGPYDFSNGNLREQCDVFHFWSLHPGGANFANVDGSVHFMTYTSNAILPPMSTIAGGEAVEIQD
jgi:prepilin-type N-terminal cleavage/methylation domain-containing protein